MSQTLVKVRIKDGYEGHHHKGVECSPGQIIEVTPKQAAWLHKVGATDPVEEGGRDRKSRSRRSAAAEQEAEDSAEESDEATTTGEDTLAHDE